MSKEADSGPMTAERVWKKWERELNAAEEHERTWMVRAKKIVRRYRDERDASERDVTRFNILYSNTEVLKGALYQKTPTPEVRRRYNDKDPVGRAGAEVLDRCLSYSIDSYDFDGTIRAVLEDSLLPGRGIARVKYVPQMAEVEGAEQVVYEEARCEYHDWELFRYSPAKRWDKVRWVAFGDLLTREDLVGQFGKVGEQVKLDWAPEGKRLEEADEVVKRALVWSVWNKTDRKLYVWASGYNKGCLAVVPDPLRLEGFFPCPQPLYSICTTGSMVPVPDYTEYEDQAIELDEITGRITALTDALRFRGLYDKQHPELAEIARAGDGEFIPAENIAALAEKGGLENSLMTMPLDELGKVLVGLYEQREQIKQAIYEITGISDIFRGASEAQETATAQQIKAQYGGIRVRGRQQAVQAFVRDILRLKAEIMAEHFSPQTLAQMSGVQLPSEQDKQMARQAIAVAQATGQPPPPQVQEVLALPAWEEVVGVISNDRTRGFRIDIETDSTVQPDQQLEQQSRVEAITAFATMLERAVPAVQLGLMSPEIAQKSIGWVLRSFKNPGELEEALEKMGSQPPPPPPDNGEAAAAQAEAQKAQLEAKIAESQQILDAKIAEAQAQLDARQQALDARQQQIDAAIAQMAEDNKRAIADANNAAKLEAERIKAALKVMEIRAKAAEQAQARQEKEAERRDKEREKAEAADKEARQSREKQASDNQTGTALAAAITGMTAVLSELGKPRKTTLQRGPDGRAVGAVSEPA